MKFNQNYKGSVAGICSKEQSVFCLNNPYLDVDKKVLVATDGRALVVIPVTPSEGDLSGIVDLRAVKAYSSAMKVWRKTKLNFGRKTASLEPSLACGESVVFTDSDGSNMCFPRVSDKNFPKWESVIPTEKSKPVRLNPTFLKNLFAAMLQDGRPEGITLWVPEDATKAILVSANFQPAQAVGVLMPMRGEDVAPTLKGLERK